MRYLFFKFAILLKAPFSRYSRRKRLKVFLDEMKIHGGERIIDLGGAAAFWANVRRVVSFPNKMAYSTFPFHSMKSFLVYNLFTMYCFTICDYGIRYSIAPRTRNWQPSVF